MINIETARITKQETTESVKLLQQSRGLGSLYLLLVHKQITSAAQMQAASNLPISSPSFFENNAFIMFSPAN